MERERDRAIERDRIRDSEKGETLRASDKMR